MVDPKISIIIPVYNGSNYMREAIDSALAQTYGNFEVLVVNDGSNDGGATREIALSYGDKIRYFEKENGGVATALNLALAQMEGEYFSWLSHDDLYYPNKLTAEMNALLERGDLRAIVYSDYDIWDMDKGEKWPARWLDQYPRECLENSVFPLIYTLLHGCSLLIHKSHFQRAGIFNEALLTTQDYDLWFQMFRNQRLVFVPTPLICARLHSQQGTHTMPRAVREEGRRLYLKAAASLTEEEISRIFGHPFLFYNRLLEIFGNFGLDEDCRTLEAQYGISEISKSFGQKVRKWFSRQGWDGRRLCIFCCGEYGKNMLSLFLMLGFKVDYFSDNNSERWGQNVEGVPCISPAALQKISGNTLIVAAIHSPGPIVEQLKALGCPHVITKQFFDRQLFELGLSSGGEELADERGGIV